MELATVKQLLERAKKLQQAEQLPAAQKIYQQILKNYPHHAEALNFLGILYLQLQQPELAVQHLQKALSIVAMPQIYHNLGLAYQSQQDWQQALNYYQQAVRIFPHYYQVWHKLANVYVELDQWDLAQQYYQKALTIKPDYAEAWLDLGNFYYKQNKIYLAKEAFEKAIKADEKYFAAYLALANSHAEARQYEQAILFFQKALKLQPNDPQCFANLCRVYDEICDWHNYSQRQQQLLQQARYENKQGEINSVNPLSVLAYPWSGTDIANVAKSHAKFIAKKMVPWQQKLNFQFKKNPKKKLRLGYLSCGFGNHPTAQLTYRLFECHQREQFEIFAFSFAADKHSNLQHFAKHADQFFDIGQLSAVAAAKLIYENKIDILIDLDGHIRGNRLAIAALRPAPVQIHYLGFPGTTGATFIDYFIADHSVMTDAATKDFSEKIIYLPHSYQMTNNHQSIAEKKLQRIDYQLPTDAFIFCCFNNSYKIEPTIFSIWCDILRAVPNSVLWLLSHSVLTEKNLKREAQLRGIAPERLIFAKYEEKPDHLARYQLADIFLDTLYCNAHTTASDALWAGLPVLTCPQENFAGRVATSLLKAMGLAELIMPNLEAYQTKAIALAQAPLQLQHLRVKLQQQRLSQPLFATEQFVLSLESAYQQAWQHYCQSQQD